MLNANKRAITLNLKSERGRALLRRDGGARRCAAGEFLARHDGRTGRRLRGAEGDQSAAGVRHRIGFGITGPDRDNLAMDFTIQAQSGIMSVTGFPDGPPVKAGPTLVDFMGGIHLYAAVVTALLQRERTGLGQLVEVAMQETVYSSLASSMEYHRAHRRDAAAHRQPPVGAGERAVQRVSHRRWLGGDPRGDRGALEEPGEGDGARGTGATIRASPPTPRASRIWRRPTRRWRRGRGRWARWRCSRRASATAFRARRCAPCRR